MDSEDEDVSLPPDLCYHLASLKKSDTSQMGAHFAGERCFHRFFLTHCRFIAMDDSYVRRHFDLARPLKGGDPSHKKLKKRPSQSLEYAFSAAALAEAEAESEDPLKPSEWSVLSWTKEQLSNAEDMVRRLDETKKESQNTHQLSSEALMSAVDAMGEVESTALFFKAKLDTHRFLTQHYSKPTDTGSDATESAADAESADSDDRKTKTSESILSVMRKTGMKFHRPKNDDVAPLELSPISEDRILEFSNFIPFQVCLSHSHLHFDVAKPRPLKRRRHSKGQSQRLLQEFSTGESEESIAKMEEFFREFLQAHESAIERRSVLINRHSSGIAGRYSIPRDWIDLSNVFCEASTLCLTAVNSVSGARLRIKLFGYDQILRLLWLCLLDKSVYCLTQFPSMILSRTDLVFTRMLVQIYDEYISHKQVLLYHDGYDYTNEDEMTAMKRIDTQVLKKAVEYIEEQWSNEHGTSQKLPGKMQNKMFERIEEWLYSFLNDDDGSSHTGWTGYRISKEMEGRVGTERELWEWVESDRIHDQLMLEALAPKEGGNKESGKSDDSSADGKNGKVDAAKDSASIADDSSSDATMKMSGGSTTLSSIDETKASGSTVTDENETSEKSDEKEDMMDEDIDALILDPKNKRTKKILAEKSKAERLRKKALDSLVRQRGKKNLI